MVGGIVVCFYIENVYFLVMKKEERLRVILISFGILFFCEVWEL